MKRCLCSLLLWPPPYPGWTGAPFDLSTGGLEATLSNNVYLWRNYFFNYQQSAIGLDRPQGNIVIQSNDPFYYSNGLLSSLLADGMAYRCIALILRQFRLANRPPPPEVSRL
jgi:hypothetical protein